MGSCKVATYKINKHVIKIKNIINTVSTEQRRIPIQFICSRCNSLEKWILKKKNPIIFLVYFSKRKKYLTLYLLSFHKSTEP